MIIYGYDERQQEDCSVHLSAPVAQWPLAGVGISLPSGTVQLRSDKYLTHLVFTVYDEKWCVKITGRECLGDDLFLYSYTVDYLKDYWLKYAAKPVRAMVHRSSNVNLWEVFTPDDLFPISNNTTTTRETVGTFPISSNTWRFVVVLATQWGFSVYALDDVSWYTLMTHGIMDNADVANCIQAAFLVPALVVAGYATGPEVDLHDVQVPTADGPKNLISTSDTICMGTPVSPTGSQRSPVTFTTSYNIPHTDWRDGKLSIYTMYAPFIGTVGLDPSLVYGNITIQYYFDLVGGTVQATFNNSEATRTAAAYLPQPPIPTNNAAAALRALRNSALASGNDIIASSFAGALTGSKLAPGWGTLAGAGIGALTSIANTAVNYYANANTAKYGAVSFTSPSGFQCMYHPDFVITKVTYSQAMNMADFGRSRGYIVNDYIDTLGDLGRGHYYWLDLSTATLYGGDEYAEAVRRAYHNQRIKV